MASDQPDATQEQIDEIYRCLLQLTLAIKRTEQKQGRREGLLGLLEVEAAIGFDPENPPAPSPHC